MTIYEMLKEIVSKGEPWSTNNGVCVYCSASLYSDADHRENCTWKLAEEYIQRKEES